MRREPLGGGKDAISCRVTSRHTFTSKSGFEVEIVGWTYLWKRGFEGRVGQKGSGARDGGGRESKRGRQTEEEELEERARGGNEWRSRDRVFGAGNNR